MKPLFGGPTQFKPVSFKGPLYVLHLHACPLTRNLVISILAIVNNAAVNTGYKYLFNNLFSLLLDVYASGIIVLYGHFIFNILRNLYIVLHSG